MGFKSLIGKSALLLYLLGAASPARAEETDGSNPCTAESIGNRFIQTCSDARGRSVYEYDIQHHKLVHQTHDYNNDGTPETEFKISLDRKGNISKHVTVRRDFASLEMDVTSLIRDSRGNFTQEIFDKGNDGIIDAWYTIERNGNGTPQSSRWYEFDSSGKLTQSVAVSYNDYGLLRRVAYDFDGDSRPDYTSKSLTGLTPKRIKGVGLSLSEVQAPQVVHGQKQKVICGITEEGELKEVLYIGTVGHDATLEHIFGGPSLYDLERDTSIPDPDKLLPLRNPFY